MHHLQPFLAQVHLVAHGLRDALLTRGKKDRSSRVKGLRDALIAEQVPDPAAEGAAELTR